MATRGWRRPAPALLLVLLVAGCASVSTQRVDEPVDRGDSPVAACVALFERTDAEVELADVRDARAERIDGFPWLRVDRPLASFRYEVGTSARFTAWVNQLAHLDARARGHELANLPDPAHERLHEHWQPAARARGLPSPVDAALGACRDILNADLRGDDDARDRLQAAATVPDAYVTWMRALGLYPITRWLARPQVKALHERKAAGIEAGADPDLVQDYATPRHPRAEQPADAAPVARGIRRDALDIPLPTPEQRAILFAAHAPIWRVETASAADRPGALRLDADGRSRVDSEQPVEYRDFSWTRFDELVLPQLSYTLWFPERAAEGWLDLYAGHLDAVTWRVTLGPDGRVLAYESIHACGCYYTLLPGAGWQAISDIPRSQEPVYAPMQAPEPAADEQVRVTLEQGRHYILGVDTVARAGSDANNGGAGAGDARPLAPLPSAHLRSLPLPAGGSASVYDSDGFIPSTSRAERFLLWPMGVRDAGAMRQHGHHAIAFIGRRHFDDPRLLENLLERAD